MTIEKAIRILAGGLVAASLALGADASPLFASRHFLWVAAFVAANLLQSTVTGFCPAELVLRAAGLPAGGAAAGSRR